MLTVKQLKEELNKHDDEAVVLLFDSNRKKLGIKPNSLNNSFENLLPCHICDITIEDKNLLAKSSMINQDTGEIVWGFVNPNGTSEELKRGVKAVFISPDLLDEYGALYEEKK